MNTRRRGRPRLQETAEIDGAIRDAAVAVLLEQGDAATINAVAEAAGLSRKSVYARYPTKSELFTDAIRDLMARAPPFEFPRGGSPDRQLYNYIRAALEAMSSPRSRAIQAILTADPSYIAVLRSEMITAVRTQFYEPLGALLVEFADCGEIVAIDVPRMTQAINSMIFAFGSGYQKDMSGQPDGLSLDDQARMLTDLIARGILPR